MGSRARPATGTATRVPRPLAASRRDDEKKEDNGRGRAAGHSHRRGSLHGLGQLPVLGARDVRPERRRLCGRDRPVRLGRRAGADRGRGLPDRRHLALARRCRRHERRAVLMPIALTEEHEALRRTAERWLETHCPAGVPRAVTEAARAEQAALPDVWEKMAAQGWLGLHVPEEFGGQGFATAEVAVVLEELGHALFPGPVLPTVVVSAALASHGTTAARAAWLPGLSTARSPRASPSAGSACEPKPGRMAPWCCAVRSAPCWACRPPTSCWSPRCPTPLAAPPRPARAGGCSICARRLSAS